MSPRLRLFLASALAALTSGPWSYSIWLTNGTYSLELTDSLGTTVGHVLCTVTDVKPRTRWADLGRMVSRPAFMALPPGRIVEATGTGPFEHISLRMWNVESPGLAPAPGMAMIEGRSAATIIEVVRPPTSSAVPWQAIGKGASAALTFVCTMFVNCPTVVHNFQNARRWANRRPIGFRLALPLLIVIPLLAYALSRRILVIEPAHAQPDPQSDTDPSEIGPPEST